MWCPLLLFHVGTHMFCRLPPTDTQLPLKAKLVPACVRLASGPDCHALHLEAGEAFRIVDADPAFAERCCAHLLPEVLEVL